MSLSVASNVFTWSRRNTDLQNWVVSCLKHNFSLLPSRVFRKDRRTSLKSTRASYLQTADASEETGVFSLNVWHANTSETSPRQLVSPCDLLCQAYSIWFPTHQQSTLDFKGPSTSVDLSQKSLAFTQHESWHPRVCWSISQSLSLKGEWAQQLSLWSPSQLLLHVFKWLLHRSHLVFY